ncbi:MAG: nucleotidyltransferase [Anaerolineae bacterium]
MDCLDGNFGLYAFFLGGSLLSDTRIRGHGGVDYFASIGDDRLPDDSDAFLIEVGRALDECFPGEGVTVKAPAIIVPIGSNDGGVVRIVPAKLAGQTSTGHRLYAVADGMGGWMTSSPDAHSDYIASVDLNLDGKLRPLICLLKAWKYFRDVPVSSFYLELRCAAHADGEKMIVYTVDLRNVLDLLWDDQFADVQDPKGISGHVSARLTYAGKKAAISKLRTALYHTSRAQEAAAEGRVEESFLYWNRVFNGYFPPYG